MSANRGDLEGLQTYEVKRSITRSRESTPQMSVSLKPHDRDALTRIADYYGCSKAEAIRVMIRYFEVNLKLAPDPKKGG